jgi:hypothetical protein
MEMAHDDGAAYAKLTTFWNIPCEAKRKELTEKLGLTRNDTVLATRPFSPQASTSF